MIVGGDGHIESGSFYGCRQLIRRIEGGVAPGGTAAEDGLHIAEGQVRRFDVGFHIGIIVAEIVGAVRLLSRAVLGLMSHDVSDTDHGDLGDLHHRFRFEQCLLLPITAAEVSGQPGAQGDARQRNDHDTDQCF